MILYITDRNIRVDDADNQISYNSDYIAEFHFDDEWNGKIKTARFVQNGEYVDVVLVDDRCDIPPLKTGFIRIGVFSDSMTSTYADVYFKTSIKDGTGNPTEPPEDVYAQLTSLIESGMLKGEDGLTPYVGENNNWWIGDIDTGILARGYTPRKGVDYFTEGEIQQIQNEVSSGAIGDFKVAVDSETNKFDANATEKLNAYNSNAETKLDEYNTNANNRVSEFDAHTEQIQTDISGLKSDLTGLQTVVDSKADKTDLAKTNLYLDTLYKLNKGQTYDVLEQESNAYAVDVPSGSKYASIDMVGGKSIVWNQLCENNYVQGASGVAGIEVTNSDDGKIIFNGTTSTSIGFVPIGRLGYIEGHKYYVKPYGNYAVRIDSNNGNSAIGVTSGYYGRYKEGIIFTAIETYEKTTYKNIYARPIADVIYSNEEIWAKTVDLTVMFGSGNEPSTVEEFEAMFPDDYYPYSEPTIISSQTDRVDVVSADGISQQITTGFPVLNSAGRVYDYIDLNEGKLHQRVGVVDLGTLGWTYYSDCFYSNDINGCKIYKENDKNTLCQVYAHNRTAYGQVVNDKVFCIKGRRVWVSDSAYTDATVFKNAMSGVMLYYELAEEIVTDIEIPTELADWLTVEAGGSITFHNADDGKRLLIPNKETFIRKLDEVTV